MNSFPVTSHLHSAFRKIGADVRVVPPIRVPRPRPWLVALNAERIRVRDDRFELVLPGNASATILDCRRDERHLVLSVQEPGVEVQQFLCGFDERHWFAAAVKGSTVRAAKESLLPPQVREVALRARIRHAHLFRRHNRAFVRQGEWFFVPDDTVTVNPLLIRHREPLIRPGGGKPHVVDELVRGAGELLWHHPAHAPGGFTQEQFARLPENLRQQPQWSRRVLVRNGSIAVRGAVRHSDHATIFLRGWHRVFINSEQRPASLGFLD